VSKLDAVLDDLLAEDLTAMAPPTLLVETEELIAAAARLQAAISLRLAAMHAGEVTVQECGYGVKTWLEREQRFSRRAAGQQVAVARSLAEHPALAAAYTSGAVSFDHARAVTGCLRTLPANVIVEAEQILVDAARDVPVDDLRVAAERARDAWGAETAREREERKFASRWLETTATFDGMIALSGMLDPESGATLHTALTALMAQHAADDERSAGQRRADALVDLARIATTTGRLPQLSGDRPRVTVTIDWETLRDQIDDSRNAGTLTAGPLGDVPVTAGTVRRIACDAHIIPAVLGGASELLDLGRATPTWSTGQRRAAALRDSGCVFRDCRASLDRCELHHLKYWSLGGPTDLSNSAYLCHFHHWLVHHRNWTIHRDSDTQRVVVRRT
jgi:hypothetical protein